MSISSPDRSPEFQTLSNRHLNPNTSNPEFLISSKPAPHTAFPFAVDDNPILLVAQIKILESLLTPFSYHSTSSPSGDPAGTAFR